MLADIFVLPAVGIVSGLLACRAAFRMFVEGKPEGRGLCKADIKAALLSEKTVKELNSKVEGSINELLENESASPEELLNKFIPEDKLSAMREDFCGNVSERIRKGLMGEDFAELLSEQAASAIKEKLKNSFFGSIVSDKIIAGMVKPVGTGIQKYLCEHSDELIKNEILAESESYGKRTLKELSETAEPDKEKLTGLVEKLYREAVENGVAEALAEDMRGELRRKSYGLLYLRGAVAGLLAGIAALALEYAFYFLYL